MVIDTHEDLTGELFWTNHPGILTEIRSRCVKSHSNATVLFSNSCEAKCLPGTWVVLRLDGRCFHKYVA